LEEKQMSSNQSAWRYFLFVAAMTLFLAFSWHGQPETLAYDQSFVVYESDQVVVKLAEGADIDAINASYGTTLLRPLVNSYGIYLLQTADGQDAAQSVQLMLNDSRLLYVEPNYIGSAPEAFGVEIFGWPEGDAQEGGDDAMIGVYHDLTVDDAPEPARYLNQPARQNIKLNAAHLHSRGAGVIVAVLDTGVDLNHPLLRDHLTAVQYDFIDDDPIAQDEFYGLDDNGQPVNGLIAGHGTHVAGIIRLVAPDALIMPLRVLDPNGQGNIFVVAEAMLFAAANGANVINLSLGTAYQSDFMTDVLNQLAAQGIVVVGSAGNLNMNVPQYPAAANCALAVTAVGPGPVKTEYASYGAWVNLAAPGERIYSAYPGGGYAWWSGTSMAAPFVSGQAALLRSANPDLTLAQMGQIIAATVTPIDQQNQGYAGQLGAGRINAGDSLDYLVSNQWQSAPATLLAGCN
jgi:thermitase